MFSDIIVYAGDTLTSLRAARILSDTAYFRVRSFGAWSRWKGRVETGAGVHWKEAASPSPHSKKRKTRTPQEKR